MKDAKIASDQYEQIINLNRQIKYLNFANIKKIFFL